MSNITATLTTGTDTGNIYLIGQPRKTVAGAMRAEITARKHLDGICDIEGHLIKGASKKEDIAVITYYDTDTYGELYKCTIHIYLTD